MYTLKQGERRRRRWPVLVVFIILAATYTYWSMNSPLPYLRPSLSAAGLQTATAPAKLTWPGAGQSAVGILGSPVLETHGKQTPRPTASTAKLITALVVLQKKPIRSGQQGPVITLTANDVAIFNTYFAHGGSLTKVQAGERISEYQMLQAILLPSANNMADSLAIWAFGSLPAYSAAANQYLIQHGLNGTHVDGDASGFNPSTVSTAHDLVRLGELAMQDPILAGIVDQKTAALPVAGNVNNVNFLLGTHNIVGVKTGNTDQAGGVYVSASRIQVNGRFVTIVTAIADSPSLFQALKDSLPLIQSAQANFARVTAAKAGEAIAIYRLPWGGSVSAKVDRDLTTTAWKGSKVEAQARLDSVPADSKAGSKVGSLIISGPIRTGQSVDLRLASAPSKPSAWWRLSHPLR